MMMDIYTQLGYTEEVYERIKSVTPLGRLDVADLVLCLLSCASFKIDRGLTSFSIFLTNNEYSINEEVLHKLFACFS